MLETTALCVFHGADWRSWEFGGRDSVFGIVACYYGYFRHYCVMGIGT